MNTVVVNLFGGPGIGKSTTAALLVGELKKRDIQAEYIQEYIKDVIYASRSDRLTKEDQKYYQKMLDGSLISQAKVFQAQKFAMDIKVDQVEVLVTDAPLPLNIIYLKDKSEHYIDGVLSAFRQEYNNVNFSLVREKDALFQEEGRIHTEEESKEKDSEIVSFLKEHDIDYTIFDRNNIAQMVDHIISTYNSLNNDNKTLSDVSVTDPKKKEAPVASAPEKKSVPAEESKPKDIPIVITSAVGTNNQTEKPIDDWSVFMYKSRDGKGCKMLYLDPLKGTVQSKVFEFQSMRRFIYNNLGFNEVATMGYLLEKMPAQKELSREALKVLNNDADKGACEKIPREGNAIQNYILRNADHIRSGEERS